MFGKRKPAPRKAAKPAIPSIHVKRSAELWLDTFEPEAALKRELLASLELLRESVPLALERLQQSGVDLLAQSCFWSTAEQYAEFCDLIDYSSGDLDAGPSGLQSRIEELQEQLKEPDPA